MKRYNWSTLLFEFRFKDLITYPCGVLFYVYCSKGYLNRKDIYLNKQKAFAKEIKEKIKASIDAQFYTK